jgi:hypothetical protein
VEVVDVHLGLTHLAYHAAVLLVLLLVCEVCEREELRATRLACVISAEITARIVLFVADVAQTVGGDYCRIRLR